jgi:hypothetical protein
MATQLELALFAKEFIEVKTLPEAERWELERDKEVPLGLFVTLYPISQPDDRYRARIRWNDYFGAFSLKFVNLKTGSVTDPTAWPQCFGFRPTSFDACLPWTAEGQALHPEWRTSGNQSFPTVEVPVQYALLRLQLSLDSTYQGRGHG